MNMLKRTKIFIFTSFFIAVMAITVLISASCAAAVQSVDSLRQMVKGNYALGTPNQLFSDSVVSNPYIDGLAIRTRWNLLEPVENQYDWSFLDAAISQAKSHGKMVSLSVTAGVNTPDWVYQYGVKTFKFIDSQSYRKNTFCTEVAIPVPYDPIYLEKWKKFVAAFGARYNSNPAVTKIRITGINDVTAEIILPHSRGEAIDGCNKYSYDDVQNWIDAGYTASLIKNTWLDIAKTFQSAFPDKGLSTATYYRSLPKINDLGRYDKNLNLADDIFSSGIDNIGHAFIPEQHNLSAFYVSDALIKYVFNYAAGFQMLWSVTGDDTYRMNNQIVGNPKDIFKNAINNGIDSGVDFLEIYNVDVANADFQDILQYAHKQILNTPRIFNVAASAISVNSVSINWDTHELADSLIVYGKTDSYEFSSTINRLATANHSVVLTDLAPATTYNYKVISKDSLGHTASSSEFYFTTLVDDVAPSPPANLFGVAVSSSQIDLSWSAATDNVKVVGYKIYRNGVYLGSTTVTRYPDTNLTDSTNYSYYVSAYDGSGNNSSQSFPISVKTLSADGGYGANTGSTGNVVSPPVKPHTLLVLPDGSLIKSFNASEVYFMENGMKRWVINEVVFRDLDFQWDKIKIVPDEVLGDYPIGKTLDKKSKYPDNMLVRGDKAQGGDGVKVFILQKGVARWIATQEYFEGLGLDWRSVMDIASVKLSKIKKGAPFVQQTKVARPFAVLESTPDKVIEETSVIFRFTGVTGQEYDKNLKFDTFIEGLDSKWVAVSGHERKATLPAKSGLYKFFVRAVSPDGGIDPLPKSYAFEVKLSPYFGQVSISGSGLSLTDPNKEKITLTGKNTEPISLNGWTVGSLKYHTSFIIPENAYEIPDQPYYQYQKDLYIYSKAKINIFSGASPMGVNFRLNKCIGYLKNYYKFDPVITNSCPKPLAGDIKSFSAYCQKTINSSVASCKEPDLNDILIDAECRDYMKENLSYSKCVENSSAFHDFLTNEWRVYLRRPSEIWANEKDSIILRDADGLLVGKFQY